MTLGRNILWNFGSLVWLSLLVLFVTPYMVHRMGLDAFGAWSVITAFTGYLTAMDLGLSSALIRFLAAEHEKKNQAGFTAFLRSGVSLQLLSGLIAAIACLLLAGPLVHHWARVPPELSAEAVASFRLGALVIFLGFAVMIYSAVPAALRRFDLLALKGILLITLQYLLFVAVLRLGGGLFEVVAAYAAGNAIIVAYLVWVTRRIAPGAGFLPGWDRRAAGEILRFGRFKFPAQISTTLLQNSDRIALAALVPVGRVSYYFVPLRVAQRLGMMVESISAPFYPTVTSHLSAERVDALRSQYRMGTRIVAVVASGSIAVLGGLAMPILAVWMGDDFAREGTLPFRLLLAAYAAAALFMLPSVAADSAARPAIPATFLGAGSLLHLAVLWLLVPRFGLTGAAVGVLTGYLVPLVFGVPWIHRQIAPLPRLGTILADMSGAALAGAVTMIAALLVAGTSWPASGVPALLLSLAGCSLLHVGALFAFRGIRGEEFRRLLAILSRGKGREAA